MSDSQISDALIERYRKVTVTTVYSGVRGQGYDPNFMKGVHARTPGANLVGRAKALRFVPPRPDIQQRRHVRAAGPRTPVGDVEYAF